MTGAELRERDIVARAVERDPLTRAILAASRGGPMSGPEAYRRAEEVRAALSRSTDTDEREIVRIPYNPEGSGRVTLEWDDGWKVVGSRSTEEDCNPRPVDCAACGGECRGHQDPPSRSTGERCVQGCHLDIPTGVMHHSPGCPRLTAPTEGEVVAWAIEVTVRPEGAEPYDDLGDVYLDPADAHRMAQNYAAMSNPRVVPLVRLAPTQEPEDG